MLFQLRGWEGEPTLPLYVRKSISAGPFRFNFSNAGVGVSVGVRGLRVGTGPRGHYIHAGVGGLYYRSSVRRAGRRGTVTDTEPRVPREMYAQNDVVMVDIDSSDVIQMRDETFGELLDEINEKSNQIRMSVAFCWAAIIVGSVALFASAGVGAILVLLSIPSFMLGRWLDSYRRSTVLYYDLEGDAEESYQRLMRGFDGLLCCAGKWHIEAGGAITSLTDWKRNAGASHLVKKSATLLSYLLPSVIKSNVTPPAIRVGKQILFFMPDVVLFQDGAKFGAVPYAELMLNWQETRFIEESRVPSDARIVGYTWKHPNKNGGPDRRFRDNRQIPICLYETIHFHSGSGINELVELSQVGKTAAFAEGCARLSLLPKEKAIRSLPTTLSVTPKLLVEQSEPQKRRSLSTFFLVTLSVTIGLLALGIVSSNLPSKEIIPTVDDSIRITQNKKPEPVNDATLNKAPQSSHVADTQAQRALNPPTSDVAPATKAPSSPPSSIKPSLLSAASAGEAGSDLNVTRYTRSAVNLREEPNAKSRILRTVPKHAAVRILRR